MIVMVPGSQPLCAGQWDLFFTPDHLESPNAREFRENRARALCSRCPGRAPCLEGALARNERHGIWAGLNEEEIAAERLRREGVAA